MFQNSDATHSKPLIGLLTDFGPDNHYTAQMKGKILGWSRDCRLVDITHSIGPQNIAHAAYVLRDTIEAFPPSTIFVVVVDPGVGTQRRIVIIEANEQVFVMPDNGLISVVAEELGVENAIEVEGNRFEACSTFHGRDIMAPVAARMACGEPTCSFGDRVPVESLCKLKLQIPKMVDRAGRYHIEGQLVYSDLFGNLVSNIRQSLLPANAEGCTLHVGKKTLHGIWPTFSHAKAGEMLAITGSHRRVEIAVNRASALEVFRSEHESEPVGMALRLEWQ